MSTLFMLSVFAMSAMPPVDLELWLETQLHARYPRVDKWQIHSIDASHAERSISIERLTMGQVGPRTEVTAYGHDAAGREVVTHRWFVVEGYARGVMAARNLSARATLTADAIETGVLDVLQQDCEPLSVDKDAIGRQLRRSRRAGQAICSEIVRQVPAVERGATVVLKATAGPVELMVAAISRADADVGERVQVQRIGANASLWTVVTAPGEVRVDE